MKIVDLESFKGDSDVLCSSAQCCFEDCFTDSLLRAHHQVKPRGFGYVASYRLSATSR